MKDVGSSFYIAKRDFYKRLIKEDISHLWEFLPFAIVKLKPSLKQIYIKEVYQRHKSVYNIYRLFTLGLKVLIIKITNLKLKNLLKKRIQIECIIE